MSTVLAVVALLTLQQAASSASPNQAIGEVSVADSPRTTVAGNAFIAPAGWRVEVKGQMTLVSPPEPDSHIALIDLKASDADNAVRCCSMATRKPMPTSRRRRRAFSISSPPTGSC